MSIADVAPIPRLAYTPTEALQAVPISRTKLFALIASGELRTIKVGKRRLIPVDALEAFIVGGDAA